MRERPDNVWEGVEMGRWGFRRVGRCSLGTLGQGGCRPVLGAFRTRQGVSAMKILPSHFPISRTRRYSRDRTLRTTVITRLAVTLALLLAVSLVSRVQAAPSDGATLMALATAHGAYMSPWPPIEASLTFGSTHVAPLAWTGWTQTLQPSFPLW